MSSRIPTSQENVRRIFAGSLDAVNTIDDFVDDEKLSEIMDMQRSV